jgi:hypothetical protein
MKQLVHQFRGISLKMCYIYVLKMGAGERRGLEKICLLLGE